MQAYQCEELWDINIYVMGKYIKFCLNAILHKKLQSSVIKELKVSGKNCICVIIRFQSVQIVNK